MTRQLSRSCAPPARFHLAGLTWTNSRWDLLLRTRLMVRAKTHGIRPGPQGAQAEAQLQLLQQTRRLPPSVLIQAVRYASRQLSADALESSQLMAAFPASA